METYRDGEAFGALGDRSRRAIVLLLAERPQAVGELAAGLPISRPAVSQHLKVLKDAGLVEEEHRHLERHGEGWEGVREGVDDDAGWPLHLSRYAALIGA